MRADAQRALGPLGLVRIALAVAALSLFAGLGSLAASPIRQLTVTTSVNLRPAWSPDAKRIAFQRSEGDEQFHVYVMDVDGGNARRVTSGDVDDRHPAWSPDGKLLAVDSGTSVLREIWIIDVATMRRTQVTKLGANASFPSFSPDGARIAFYVYRDGVSELWLSGRDGGGAQPITRGLASEQNQQCTFACHAAAWSPRGDQLALSAGDHSKVLVMAPVPASALAAISPDDERSHFPLFLADGRLVYVSEHITLDQSWTDLWALPPGASATTNAPRVEIAGKVQAQGPFELSPDGQQLLFASPRSGNFEIYAVTLDAAGKAALAERLAQSRGPDPTAAAATAAVAVEARRSSQGPFGESFPYLLGLVAIGAIGLGIELLVRARRLKK